MNRMPQLPRVFVGSPYGGNFNRFKRALDDIPFRILYAKELVSTRQLLEKSSELIDRSDFCLFDVSTGNPNVMLELGLAEGLGVEYFVLRKVPATWQLPADIKGISRVEYRQFNQCAKKSGRVAHQGLWYRVAHDIATKDLTLNRLWKNLERHPDKDKCRLYSFRLLARLRDKNPIHIQRERDGSILLRRNSIYGDVSRGVNAHSRNNALQTMKRMRLVVESARTIRLSRRLFPPS